MTTKFVKTFFANNFNTYREKTKATCNSNKTSKGSWPGCPSNAGICGCDISGSRRGSSSTTPRPLPPAWPPPLLPAPRPLLTPAHSNSDCPLPPAWPPPLLPAPRPLLTPAHSNSDCRVLICIYIQTHTHTHTHTHTQTQ